MIADASSAETRASRIGRVVRGHAIPVIDERAVRAAAGIMFLLGGAAFATAFFTGSAQPLQPFGMFFMIDMLLRVTAGDRWSPTLMLGRLAVKGQRPEWVGAPQKELAWWLGFGLALVLCGSCLTLLFLETSFGICVGCALQSRFSKQPPKYCPGDTCDTGSSTHFAAPWSAPVGHPTPEPSVTTRPKSS